MLGSGVAATVLATVGVSPAWASGDHHPRPASPERRGYAFLDAAMDGYPTFGTNRLAQSYTDQAGLFSTAFTYDNALCVLAYLAVRRPSSPA